jgi:hypothetical protein
MSLCLLNVQEIDLDLVVISEFNTCKDLNAGMEDTSLDELASGMRRCLPALSTVRSAVPSTGVSKRSPVTSESPDALATSLREGRK